MFERSVGKKPVPYIASSRTRTGGITGVKPGLREVVERELVERHRDPCGVADDVAEASARDPCGAFHVEAADLRVLARLRELRRLADTAQLLGVVLGVSVRHRVVRRVGHEGEDGVTRGFGRGELLLGLLERRLDRTEGFELLRGRLALQLRPAAELVDTWDQGSPALVRLEQGVELLGRAFPRERGAPGVRVAACGLQVDHEMESMKRPALLAGDGRHVGRDVGDLLLRQCALERRHYAAAVGHLRDDLVVARLRVVEVRPDVSARARVRERVAAAARRRAEEDLLARDGVALGCAASSRSSSSRSSRSSPWSRSSVDSDSVVSRRLRGRRRDLALDGLRRRGLLLLASATGRSDTERSDQENEEESRAAHRADPIHAARPDVRSGELRAAGVAVPSA